MLRRLFGRAEKPKPITEADLVAWMHQKIAGGEPRQAIWEHLESVLGEQRYALLRTGSPLEEELVGVMVRRNQQGSALEKAGRVDEAIELYEANVRDQTDTPHPYERLRIIYTMRKAYADAMRVIQEFMLTLQPLAKEKPGEYKEVNSYWTDHLRKLQRLAQEARKPKT